MLKWLLDTEGDLDAKDQVFSSLDEPRQWNREQQLIQPNEGVKIKAKEKANAKAKAKGQAASRCGLNRFITANK